MKAVLFKNIKIPIISTTTISSNGNIIVLFRSDGTLVQYDSKSMSLLLKRCFPYVALFSEFIDPTNILIATECGKFVFYDVKENSFEEIDVQEKICAIATSENIYTVETLHFFYSTGNSIVELKGSYSKVIYRTSKNITALLYTSGNLITGDDTGNIKVFKGTETTKELMLGCTKINKICIIKKNKYVAICNSGEFYYFDLENMVVIQKVNVRNSALIDCLFLDDKLHISGLDSRLISYNINNDIFYKNFQADIHYLKVLKMIINNGKIFTVGKDNIMGIYKPTKEGYIFHKFFLESSDFGCITTENTFYVSTGKDFNIFSVSTDSDTAKDESEEETTTFKVSDTLGELGYKNQSYRFLLKLETDKHILSSSVSPHISHLAISNIDETKLYKIDDYELLQEYSDLKLPPASKIIFTEKYLILNTYDSEVILLNLEDTTEIRRLSLGISQMGFYVIFNNFILGELKKIGNLSNLNESSTIDVEGNIVAVCEGQNDEAFVLTFNNIKDFYLTHSIYKISLGDKKTVFIRKVTSKNIYNNIFFYNNSIFLVAKTFITVIKNNEIFDYNFGPFILGAGVMKDKIVVIQESIDRMISSVKRPVFKHKFSTK